MDNDILPSLNDSELIPFLNKAEIIKQTAEQLIKDFEMAGFEITFSGNEITAYEELFFQVEKFVNNLIKNNFEKLMQLLYRIDVSEKKLKATTKESDELFSKSIARLIIYRELQKVVVRNYLGSK